MKVRSQRNNIARRLAITSAALVGTALTPLPAMAQDATWNGASTDYLNPANWNPASVPTNRATFSATGLTNVVNSGWTMVNQILFDANAQAYNIMNTNAGAFTIDGITGVGIDNQSATTQNILNSGTMIFNNASVIGNRVDISNFGENTGSSLTFNGTTALNQGGLLISYGESATANGTAVGTTGLATMTFNDTSSADSMSVAFRGGQATATGAGGMSTQAIASSSVGSFNGASHADDTAISLFSGISTATGGPGVGEPAAAISGGASLVFNDTSHADGTDFALSGSLALATGGAGGSGLMSPGSGAIASTGTVSVAFTDNSHADDAHFFVGGGNSVSTGGTAGAGTAVVGGEGGNSGAITGSAVLAFVDNSHADGAIIQGLVGSSSGIGGTGGAGGAADGGVGGAGTAGNGGVFIQFSGASHANGATIFMGSGLTAAVGGTGGAATAAGNGGAGGAGSATPGTSQLTLSGTSSVAGSTITNAGGTAQAYGGNGGNGGAGTGTGGAGGQGLANGPAALMFVADNVTLGAGTTLINQGGNADATGGNGGTGGTGASAGGAGGNASATGGIALVNFTGNASAGSATITNTAGTANGHGGIGGDGDVGNGGNGGTGTAQAGSATISFNVNATAGNATITNVAGAPIGGTAGGDGVDGVGGGQGGSTGFGIASAATASIIFNNTSTGGSAKITNQGGLVQFNDNSIFGTAAGAQLTNTTGQMLFTGSSSLGSGAVNNVGGTLNFGGNSTGGTGSITNGVGGFGRFQDNSTSGSATINNAGNFGFIGTSNAGTSLITNSGTLGFSGDADAVSARVINNAGGTVSISGAFLQTRLGSLSGTGSVDLGANALQVGYLNLDDSFAGVISGTGALVKRGTGTLTLTGASIYTGTTTVAAGTLILNGSVTSNTTASAAGTLRGTGTITGSLTAFGVINPGNAANQQGTLNVTGNVIFNAGSILAVNIAGANSNLLQATGNVTLSGGTVRPTSAPGTFFLMQNDYLITAGGSRTGTYTGVDESQLPSFMDASLFYTPTQAFLRLRRNSTTFAQTPNLTPNQSAVTTALDAAVAANNPLVFTTYLGTYNNLLTQPTNGPLQAALNTLSGDALTAVPVAAQEHGNRFAERLASYTWSNSSNVWGLISYGDQDADSDGNGPGFQSNGLEFQMGFNTSLGANTRLGLSVGYNDGDVDLKDRAASADIESWSLGAHLRHDFGNLYVSGQLTYTWHSIDSSRTLLLGGTAAAGYDATTWTGAAELGWVARSGNLMIEPHLSIRHASTDQDAYNEAGPVGALNVAASEYDTTRLGIGIRLANRDPQAPVRFHALLRYEHETGDNRSVLDNTLPGLPTFTVLGTRLGDNIVSAELGAEFRLTQGLSLFVAGGGHTRSNETSLNANAGLRIAF